MAYWHFVTCHRPIYPNSEKMIICTFLWPKTLKIDLIWPIFGLILDPSHITDLSWPIVPFGLSTNSVTPSHAMAYGRNGTVITTCARAPRRLRLLSTRSPVPLTFCA